MIHPTVGDLKEFTDTQLEQKLYKLNGMYFVTDNLEVRQQMLLLMDTYKLELEERRIASARKKAEEGKDDLDSLIKVS